MGPLRILFLCALLGLATVLLSAWCSTRSPWLGLTVETCANGTGVCVKAMAPKGPSQGVILPGTRLMALSDGSRSIQANRLWTIGYPYELTTYADLNHFVAQQYELYALLTQPKLIAILGNGAHVRLGKTVHRPITDLPLDFWLITLIGYGGFLISCGVWCFRRKDIAARLFAMSGSGFFLMALGIANFSSREFVVASSALPSLLIGERAGDLVLAYSWCALLWYYPTPVARAPIASMMILLIVLLGMNDILQIYQFPFHAFMVADFLLPFLLSISLVVLQWRRSQNYPVERAALKWFLLSFVVGTSLVLILQFVPLAFGIQPVTPLWLSFVALFILYLGITFGISRYRLFDLERWWLNIWPWLACGLLVIFIEAQLIFKLEVSAGEALWLATIIVGVCYIPLRQWLWELLSGGNRQSVETYLPHLNALFACSVGSHDIDARWRRLLQRVFEPLDIGSATEPLTFPQIRRDGLVLAVPGIKNTETVILTGCSRGHRLFTRVDQRLAVALFELAQQCLRQQQAHLESVHLERERILRDLHDDVAAPLMLLAHRAEKPEYRKLANTALMALREAVHGLKQPQASALSDVLADWRAEVRERLEAADVALYWEEGSMPEATLTPHERINLGRILREAISNALTHARPRTVKVSSEIKGRYLFLLIADDGVGGDPQRWIKHTGFVSMKKRVTEMGGEISWRSGKSQGTSVEALIPLWILDDGAPESDSGIVNLHGEKQFSVGDAHQSQADGFLRGLCAGADIELAVNGLDMTGDGIRRDPE